MKITETLVVLFLVLFCYLFLDKFLFRGELGEICFGPTCRALARWYRRQAANHYQHKTLIQKRMLIMK